MEEKTPAGSPSEEPADRTYQQGLEVVMAKATQLWTAEITAQWLTGREPFLDGARPIDVLRTRGPREVLDALNAAAAGSYS